MRIDCSNLLNFKKERTRMCRSHQDCYKCPLENEMSYYCTLENPEIEDITQEAINIVQKWSDEHQSKTLLDDLLEKFPNTPIEKQHGSPKLCPNDLGYEKFDKYCGRVGGCRKCWGRTLEEVGKE